MTGNSKQYSLQNLQAEIPPTPLKKGGFSIYPELIKKGGFSTSTQLIMPYFFDGNPLLQNGFGDDAGFFAIGFGEFLSVLEAGGAGLEDGCCAFVAHL